MKSVIYFVLFMAGMSVTAVAQLSPLDNVFSSNQQLIEDAVKDGLFVVRSCYRLQDTTKTEPTYFGRNNLPYFGNTYSLGIKVRSGYYTDDIAARPWLYDSNYDTYRTAASYKPVISESYYRPHHDSTYLSLPYQDRPVKEITKEQVYFTEDTVFQDKGFIPDTLPGLKKGWLVWVTTDKPLHEQPGQTLSFSIYRSELTFDGDTGRYEVRSLATDRIVLGGIYVIPDFSEVGQITFRVAGVLSKKGDQWNVVRLMGQSPMAGISTGGTDTNELTPIHVPDNNPVNNPRRR